MQQFVQRYSPFNLHIKAEMGSHQSSPLETTLKFGTVEVRNSSRSIESTTGGSANKNMVTAIDIGHSCRVGTGN